MNDITGTGGVDNTLAFKREPLRTYHSDAVEHEHKTSSSTPVWGARRYACAGVQPRELFTIRAISYATVPRRAMQKTLLGATGVQTLDDAAHRHR